MIIPVVAFCQKDSAQAAAMLDWMADLSGQQDRPCILAHENQTPAQEVQRAASRAFSTVEHLIVTACGDAWPLSANCYFGCIAFAMRGRAPWLLLEGDCVTVHPQTLDRLDEDYARANRPCLGTIIPQFFAKNGVWTETGKMLAGVAVYHQNLWNNSPLLRCLRATQAAYAKAKAIPKAFDCYLAPEILPGAGETRLIQHMGRSRNFRRVGGQILCDYDAGSRWNPMVQPETALVHGVKDGSLIALLRAEMGIPAGKTVAAPARIVMPEPSAPRRESTAFQWEDDKPVAKPDAAPRPPDRAPEPARASAPAKINHEAVATLGDARQSIQHWPDCKQHLFSLEEGRGRFRVVCQCKANSPKLPEGVDWKSVWNSQTPAEDSQKGGEASCLQSSLSTSTSTNSPAGCNAAPESKPSVATTFDDMVELAAKESDPVNHYTGEVSVLALMKNQQSGHTAFPPAMGETTATVASESTRDAVNATASPGAEDQKPAIPLQKLRFVRDIVKQFPEMAKLTPLQRRRRMNQLKKKDRQAKLKPVTKELAAKTERLLTTEARDRKLALLDMCKGRQGAFLRLRRHAESVGVTNTKLLKKDALIVAILEKEFANPYEVFAEATA